MDSLGNAFIGNPLNVGIVSALILTVVIIAFQYLKTARLKIGNIEIGKSNIGQPVQRIDETCRLKCRQIVDRMRDSIMAEMPTDSRLVAEAATFRILNPIYESIQRNHFTRIFSDKDCREAWEERICDDICRNVKVLEYHVGEQWNKFHDPQFSDYIKKLVATMRDAFTDPVIEACYAKIETYRKIGGDSMKELIDRNEGYIKALR